MTNLRSRSKKRGSIYFGRMKKDNGSPEVCWCASNRGIFGGSLLVTPFRLFLGNHDSFKAESSGKASLRKSSLDSCCIYPLTSLTYSTPQTPDICKSCQYCSRDKDRPSTMPQECHRLYYKYILSKNIDIAALHRPY